MKKLLVALVAMFCVTAASAQLNNAGVRFGNGFEVVGSYKLSKANYVEGRIGLSGGLSVTGLYNWHLYDFNWTPQVGKWFFDAGVGAGAYLGGATLIQAVGNAKLGFKLKDYPIGITFEFSPGFYLTDAGDGGKFHAGGGGSIVYYF